LQNIIDVNGKFGLEINTEKLITCTCFLTIEQDKVIANKPFENFALLKYVEITAINQNHIYKEVKDKDTLNAGKCSLSVYITQSMQIKSSLRNVTIIHCSTD
jgi:hypothetical protein